jgi:hypothetical protein
MAGTDCLASTRQQGSHGASPAPERLRDRVVGEVVDVPQGQRGALTRRQVGEHLEPVGDGRARLGQRTTVVMGELGFVSSASTTNLRERRAHGDTMQPRVERGRIAQRSRPAHGDDGDLLRDVVGRIAVAQDAERRCASELSARAASRAGSDSVATAPGERCKAATSSLTPTLLDGRGSLNGSCS